MKLVLALGVFLTIGSATAAYKPFAKEAFDLKISFALNGANVATPQVIVKQGESATIFKESNNKEYFVEVTANEGGGLKPIKMNFVVGTIDEDGHRTIVSRPEVRAYEGEKETFTVTGLDGAEAMSLSVLAKKTQI